MFLQQQVQNHVDEAIFRRYSLEMTKIEFKNFTNTKKQDIGLLFLETIQSFAKSILCHHFYYLNILSTSLCVCLNFENK